MNDRIVGYALVFTGLLVIVLSAVSVYFVFTGRARPFELFDMPPLSIPLDALMVEPGSQRPSAQSGQGPQIELLDARAINEPINAMAHLFLMGFLGGAGGRIAGLGVKLSKPVVVKINKDASQDKQNRA